MNAISYNFNRESICATCLSQNGQLIAVRDSQACILSYADLHLKPTDRICRLCHDFVQRMVAFKSRAQQAQAWLQNMENRQQNKLACEYPLTNVGMTNTSYVTATDPLKLPDFKPEPDSINPEFHENNRANSRCLQVSVPLTLQQSHQAIIPGSISLVMMKAEAEDTETTDNLHQNMACYQPQENQNRVGTPGTSNSPMLMKSETGDSEITDNLHRSMACSYQLQQNENRDGTPGTSGMLMKAETDENDGNYNDEALISPGKLEQTDCGHFAGPVVAMPLTKPKSECNDNYSDNVEYGSIQKNTVHSSDQMENNLGAVTAKPQIMNPVVENNIDVTEVAHERNTSSVDISVFTHKVKPAAAIENTPPDTAQPNHIYTETILTEEEMRQWRQAKQHTKYYTLGPTQRCEKCLEPFDNQVAMRAHAASHTEVFGELECDICQQRTIDRKAMEIHRKWHYRLLKCRYCPFVWDDVNTLRRHCRETHSVPQVLWDCDRCDRQLTSLQAWRKHERNHKVHKRAECPICGIVLNAESLKTHVKYHTGEMPLKTCQDCGKQFRGDANLKGHMRTHRTEVDETAFCVDCNIQFRNQITYKAHLKSGKHIGKEEYRFECHDCGKKFSNLGQLRIHVDIHSDIKYPCEKCAKIFNTRRCRAKHMRQLHEGRARREYICDQCGKAYTIKRLLLDHTNSHTGLRPYVCKLCGDSFGYKSALYTHGRYKHDIQKKHKHTDNIEDTETQKKHNTKKNKHTDNIEDTETQKKHNTKKNKHTDNIEDSNEIDHTKKAKGAKTKNKKVNTG